MRACFELSSDDNLAVRASKASLKVSNVTILSSSFLICSLLVCFTECFLLPFIALIVKLLSVDLLPLAVFKTLERSFRAKTLLPIEITGVDKLLPPVAVVSCLED